MIAYAPFVMIGGLVLGIVLYFFYMVPAGGNNAKGGISSLIPVPNANNNTLNLPPPGTATNGLTEGIGNMMRQAAAAANINVRNQANYGRSPGGVSTN